MYFKKKMKMCLLLGDAVKMHQPHNKLSVKMHREETYNTARAVMSHL